MLMGGKRSTGNCFKLTAPITAMIRQTTMMKYGLRMEKPDILLALLGWFTGCRARLHDIPRAQRSALAGNDLVALREAAQHFALLRCLHAQPYFARFQAAIGPDHQ